MKLVLLAIALAACGGPRPSTTQEPVANSVARPPPPDAGVAAASASTANVIAKMAEFRDQICTCSDVPCVKRITTELTRWAQAMAREPGHDVQFTDAESRQIKEITDGFSRCMAAAQNGSGASP